MRIATSLLPLFAFSAVAAAAPGEKPNILFIFSDDHAEAAISAYGSHLAKAAPTPHLDRIAREGAIFHNSFCGNSICGPSRASILTGLHSHSNGFLDNNNSRFDGTQTTFPKLLQQAGYQTAMIGKWHLGSNPTGFDHWEILPGQGSYYNPDLIQMEGGRKRYEGYVTDIVTDLSLQWLEEQRDKDKPFVLMCQHKAPHRNWCPPQRHLTLFDDIEMPEPANLFDDYGGNRSKTLAQHAMGIAKHFFWGWDMKFEGRDSPHPEYFMPGLANREYDRMTDAQKQGWDAAYRPKNEAFLARLKAGEIEGDAVTRWKYQRYIKDYLRCIRAVDENVGRMLQYLDDKGLADNTVVIYSSDQGFYLGEHGWYDKRWMFEESLAMPFLIRWPGVVPKGVESRTLIQNIDYAPTFLEIAGADTPGRMQGRSLVPAFRQPGEAPQDWREAIYYAYYGESTHSVARHDGVRTARHKLIRFPDSMEWNLFDLDEDPAEMKSLHADPAHAQTLREMQELYRSERARFGVNEGTIPRPRMGEGWWKQRHQEKVKLARQGDVDLLFIGDSITHGWEGAGREVFAHYYAGRKTLNLGYSGDRTEHVLWRLLNGELPPQVDPKVAVIMIGTNNTGHRMQEAAGTAAGIGAIVELLRDRRPEMKILLLGVFPRGEKPDDRMRVRTNGINAIAATLDDNDEHVHFLDITDQFLAEGGILPKAIMPDALHPNPHGYGIWARAMEDKLAELGGWEKIAPPAGK